MYLAMKILTLSEDINNNERTNQKKISFLFPSNSYVFVSNADFNSSIFLDPYNVNKSLFSNNI